MIGSYGHFGSFVRPILIPKPIVIEFDYLVDEQGNNLVDEQGNKLIAPIVQPQLNMRVSSNSQYIPII